VETRAEFNVVGRRVEAELAKVAGHDGNGRTFSHKVSAFIARPKQLDLDGVQAWRIVDRMPDQQAITIGRTNAILYLGPAVGLFHAFRVRIHEKCQSTPVSYDIVAD